MDGIRVICGRWPVGVVDEAFKTPVVSDTQSVHVTLTLFNWRYGQLLNFNGLTHTVLLAWPLAATAWLFALAGQPGWGAVDAGARARIG